jgi:hypothetical protein
VIRKARWEYRIQDIQVNLRYGNQSQSSISKHEQRFIGKSGPSGREGNDNLTEPRRWSPSSKPECADSPIWSGKKQ